MTPDPLTPTVRCVLLIGAAPGLEAGSNPLLGTLCHHSIGFGAPLLFPEDRAGLAASLRELAAALEAPTIPDHDLI